MGRQRKSATFVINTGLDVDRLPYVVTKVLNNMDVINVNGFLVILVSWVITLSMIDLVYSSAVEVELQGTRRFRRRGVVDEKVDVKCLCM